MIAYDHFSYPWTVWYSVILCAFMCELRNTLTCNTVTDRKVVVESQHLFTTYIHIYLYNIPIFQNIAGGHSLLRKWGNELLEYIEPAHIKCTICGN